MQQPYDGPVAAVAISPDGLRGLSASRKGELTLWDLTTGRPCLARPAGRCGLAACHGFFPDGRRAATAGRDKFVHVWDLDTGGELAAWTGHDESISGLAILPDGRRIVTGSFDAKVILWDADRGAVLHRFAMPAERQGPRVAFDADGNIVAAGNGMEGHSPEAREPDRVGRRHLRRTAPRREAVRQAPGRRRTARRPCADGRPLRRPALDAAGNRAPTRARRRPRQIGTRPRSTCSR